MGTSEKLGKVINLQRAEYYVWLVKCLGEGNPRIHSIFEYYDDIAEFYNDCHNNLVVKHLNFSVDELRKLVNTTLDDIQYVFEKYKKFHTQYITIEDDLYPRQLRNIDNPPTILFVVGDISRLDDELLLTVVGTRKESMYGKKACELICSELVYAGFSIVSGLAKGGDTTAHLTALKCKGRTYGFLACGLDVDYPYGKSELKNAIYKNGAIITEYLPGKEALPTNFRVRNRLMAGISEGTLVIEAAKISGTFITAHAAVDQGKDVFAVPSGIFWRNGAGVIKLIQNGAKPVKDALDIIEDYIDRFPEKIKIPKTNINLLQLFEANRNISLAENSANSDIEIKEIRKKAEKELKKSAKESIKNADKQIDGDLLSSKLKAFGLENNSDAEKIIEILKCGNASIDELTNKLNVPNKNISVIITKLEIAGIIEKHPANIIELII